MKKHKNYLIGIVILTIILFTLNLYYGFRGGNITYRKVLNQISQSILNLGIFTIIYYANVTIVTITVKHFNIKENLPLLNSVVGFIKFVENGLLLFSIVVTLFLLIILLEAGEIFVLSLLNLPFSILLSWSYINQFLKENNFKS